MTLIQALETGKPFRRRLWRNNNRDEKSWVIADPARDLIVWLMNPDGAWTGLGTSYRSGFLGQLDDFVVSRYDKETLRELLMERRRNGTVRGIE